MPRKQSTELSPAEWKVMKILWEIKSGALGDIHARVDKRQNWSLSTVKTMLTRLVGKGFVKTTRVGNSYLYRAQRSPVKSMLSAIDRLLENALDGTTGPILAHIIKKCDLSEHEIQDLQQLLDKHAANKGNER